MDGEIEHIRRDISDIKRKVEVIDELKAGQARLEKLMEETKWLLRDMNEHAKKQKGKPKKRRAAFGTR